MKTYRSGLVGEHFDLSYTDVTTRPEADHKADGDEHCHGVSFSHVRTAGTLGRRGKSMNRY